MIKIKLTRSEVQVLYGSHFNATAKPGLTPITYMMLEEFAVFFQGYVRAGAAKCTIKLNVFQIASFALLWLGKELPILDGVAINKILQEIDKAYGIYQNS